MPGQMDMRQEQGAHFGCVSKIFVPDTIRLNTSPEFCICIPAVLFMDMLFASP